MHQVYLNPPESNFNHLAFYIIDITYQCAKKMFTYRQDDEISFGSCQTCNPFFRLFVHVLTPQKNMYSGRYSWQIKQSKGLVNLKPLKCFKSHILTTDSIDKANTSPIVQIFNFRAF